MKYTVKNLKTFLGREGSGYNATLYRDGKKIAFVADMADGAATRFDWVDRAEEKLLADYVATLPPVKHGTYTLTQNADLYVEGLVSNLEVQRKLVSQMKTKTLYFDGDNCYSVKRAYDATVDAGLKAKYPNAIILNALSPEAATELYVKKLIDA